MGSGVARSGAGTLRPHHHPHADTICNADAVGHPDLYGDFDAFSNANSGGISYAYTISDTHSYAFDYADRNTFGDSDTFSNAHSGRIPYAYTDAISDTHSYAFNYADRNTFGDSDADANSDTYAISHPHALGYPDPNHTDAKCDTDSNAVGNAYTFGYTHALSYSDTERDAAAHTVGLRSRQHSGF